MKQTEMKKTTYDCQYMGFGTVMVYIKAEGV